MQPRPRFLRISSVWIRQDRLLTGLLLITLLAAAGCTTEPAAGVVPLHSDGAMAPAPATSEAGETDREAPLAGAPSSLEESSTFPLFVPAFGFDTYTTACEFSDDPYAECL